MRLGPAGATGLAITATVAAALSAVALEIAGYHFYGLALSGIVLHAVILVTVLLRYALRSPGPARMDPLLIASLSFILWFCITPLLRLM